MNAPSILAVADEMYTNITALLQQQGIDCEPIPMSDSDDPNRFLALLRCSRDDATITLRVQRERHVNPNGPVVVYGPGHDARSQELSQSITHILTDNGAWLPKRNAD